MAWGSAPQAFPDAREGEGELLVEPPEDEEDQQRAIERIKKEVPGVVSVSPGCSLFSTLQQWNHPRMKESRVHEELDGCIGRLFSGKAEDAELVEIRRWFDF